MADTRTPNLKLVIPSDSSKESRANLLKIDELGSVFRIDNTGSVQIRSEQNIFILPEDSSVGGNGTGGSVQLGSTSNEVTFTIYGTFTHRGSFQLLDTATSGSAFLNIRYKSDVSGSVDATDRTLSIDVEGANRNLVLGGDFTLAGGNSVTLTASGPVSVTLPTSGTLSTLAGTETLTNKTIAAGSNTITGLTNTSIDAAAAIAGSKISPDFGNQIVNTQSKYQFTFGGFTTYLRPAQSGQAANIGWDLPSADGTVNQVLATDGAGQLSWISTTVATYTANRAMQTGAGGALEASTVTSTELGYVSGVTSAIQTQLNERGRNLSANWDPGDGTTKTITHGFGTRKVAVEVLNAADDYASIEVETVKRPTDNTVVLTSSVAPSSGWIVLLTEVNS